MQAVILCGGKGSRLKPLTDEIPKPLLKLQGKPIIQHIIEFHYDHGLKDFVLCTGYLSNKVKEFIDSLNLDVSIKYSDAGKDAGILKRLLVSRPLLNDAFLVLYGDTFIDLNPNDIYKAHKKSKSYATITVAESRSPFGIVDLDDQSLVNKFVEKPLMNHFIGNMVLDIKIFDDLDPYIMDLSDGDGIVKMFEELTKKQKLSAYVHRGFQLTFNTVYEHKEADKELTDYFTQRS